MLSAFSVILAMMKLPIHSFMCESGVSVKILGKRDFFI